MYEGIGLGTKFIFGDNLWNWILGLSCGASEQKDKNEKGIRFL